MKRYPENTTVSIDDFRNCGWLKAISGATREDYSSMWQGLSSAAQQAIEEHRLSEGKLLWLLADACSMMLKPSSLNEPFAPIMAIDGKRSALPEDFQPDDVTLFAKITEEISDIKLCARIADLTWLLQKPRDPKFALIAIDKYRGIPIETEIWIRDGRECWERAIQLCIMLKAGSEERLKEIENELVKAIANARNIDGYLALWLSDLLLKYRLGRKDQLAISKKLEKLAIEFGSAGDLHQTRDYFEAAARYYDKLKNAEKSAEMTVKVAEGWVKEAIARQSSDSPSNMVSASFYENAIQKYRTVPKSQRKAYDVDNQIARLRSDLNVAGEKSLSEMRVVSSGSIDISEIIESSINAVKGKPALDALLALANIYQGVKASKVRELSEKMIREHPLQSLFSATHMSKDGRVIAKRPGADFDSEDNEVTVWAEMVKHYIMELGIVVQGDIWPALETIRQEHRIREVDFYYITKQSPIIPHGRNRLFAKALYAGYDNDFITSLHLLVPQIENLVRFHLKQHGVKTTNLDVNGIENENGLSTLMEFPKIKQIFGDDLSFEIKALFCDPFGPNLRNELAHGLIGYDESQSTHSIYAWWLGLRIVFNAFWNTTRNKQKNEATNKQASSKKSNIYNASSAKHKKAP